MVELGIERNPDTTEPDEELFGGIIKVKVTIPKGEDGLAYLQLAKDQWMKNVSWNSDRTEMTCYYEIPKE